MIRHAQMKDISRIAEMQVFGKRVAYRDIFKDDIGSFVELQVYDVIKEYQKHPERLRNMLVYDDGIVKGMINQKDDTEQGLAEETEVYEFYVEPFFKGMGIGRKLIEALMKEARQRQKKRMYLWVIRDNDSARRFYERNGFTEDGGEKLIGDTGIWDVRYSREL